MIGDKLVKGAMDNSSTASIAPPPLALYLHWPFCRVKCPYCDFNSHVSTQIDHTGFAAAYRQEMSHMASLYGRGRRLHSLFLGGGTPSPDATISGGGGHRNGRNPFRV